MTKSYQSYFEEAQKLLVDNEDERFRWFVHKETKEIHLFRVNDEGLYLEHDSQCGKVEYQDANWAGKHLKPFNIAKARATAAEIGRPACGQCIATLYTTY